MQSSRRIAAVVWLCVSSTVVAQDASINNGNDKNIRVVDTKAILKSKMKQKYGTETLTEGYDDAKATKNPVVKRNGAGPPIVCSPFEISAKGQFSFLKSKDGKLKSEYAKRKIQPAFCGPALAVRLTEKGVDDFLAAHDTPVGELFDLALSAVGVPAAAISFGKKATAFGARATLQISNTNPRCLYVTSELTPLPCIDE